jgi:hypothetical protein
MSVPNPIEVKTPKTADAFTIDRANRLFRLKDHPAFPDLFQISQELVAEATAALVDFQGWDKDQIALLKARAQAAKEHHNQFFGRIFERIAEGIQVAVETKVTAPIDPIKVAEEADNIRIEILKNHDENEEIRVAGSF